MPTYKNCIKCPVHKVVPDPDPYDSFNADDCAVICMMKKSRAERHKRFGGFHTATVACRPYMTEKETTPPPDWCPMAKLQPVKTKK